jgi:hypothetical protein
VLNGCVVLSEHSLGVDPLVPGEHFVSAEYDSIPGVLEGLLSDPGRQDAIRRAAYDLVRKEMPMTATVEAMLRAAERANGGALPTGSLAPPPPIPMPKPPSERAPEWEARAEWLGERLPERKALKELVVRTRALERRIEELSGGEERAGDVVEELGPDPGKPRVSVLLTVHDYADLVGEALRSVALGDLREVEVVAVDDASTDGSAEKIWEVCESLPWLSVRLVRRGRNGGLAAARNLAAEQARADLLFILDADNVLLPRGLGLLAGTLEEHPNAAFAYGILETFDANGPVGLESWMDWDPQRLRYGNYIDAMAMIRRSALEEVGGYPLDRAFEGGWEDFAVWVAMADGGMSGIRVPDFVARYRVSPHSMVSLTDVGHSEAWAALLRKYPVLASLPLQASDAGS